MLKTLSSEVASQTPPRRIRLAPGERKQQILAAAIAYFAEVGFEGGTRELAARLGVTQPLIYRYFPSKDDLLRAVYTEVYLNRWQPEWEALLADASRPIRERLTDFYMQYTAVIFTPEWMRIYLFAGLRGVEINHWWIRFVEDHLLLRICEAVRSAHNLPDSSAKPIGPAELDLMWMFHGGIFYYGMRREVYRVRPHLQLADFITVSIDSLLRGLPAALASILGEPPLSPLDERNPGTH